MNVYEKLATARVEFQKRNPKMSGQNKFAGYSYFELSDILPAINQIGKEIGFVTVVSFTKEIGSLLFIDSEKPADVICFESPMSTASLKGCHEVQNLGAVETYVKRYLYQNAFEIVESNILDGTMNPNEQKPQYGKQQIPVANSPKEVQQSVSEARCRELGEELGLTGEEKVKLFKQNGNNFSNLKITLEKMLEERMSKEIGEIF